MTGPRPIAPLSAFNARVRPPGSKSLTNRALVLAALARGRSVLQGPLLAEDTEVMRTALQKLGVSIEDAPDAVTVSAAGAPFPRAEARLEVGNAGTAMRFLTAACALGPGPYELDGVARMRERPVGPLTDTLQRLGARVDWLGNPGHPPFRVRGGSLRGGRVSVSPTASSQYVSALMQIGPLLAEGLSLVFDGPVVSRPYLTMTAGAMAAFGARAEIDPDWQRIVVHPGDYQPRTWAIEPDASGASYFLAAAALVPGSQCTVEGLGGSSLQGDARFVSVLQAMGAEVTQRADETTAAAPPDGRLHGVEVDLGDMPDMAQTLAVLALFAEGPTTIRNVANLRIKETDRLAALETELRRLGAEAEAGESALRVVPPSGGPQGATVETYDDHRMAMSFALAGLRVPGLRITDPGCVAKTFPDFFERLEGLRDAAVDGGSTPPTGWGGPS